MFSKKENTARWYENIVKISGIALPGIVKGTLFINSKGWNIWERIQAFVNKEFKKIGLKNISLPSFIPLSEIEKEKASLTGFIPELYLISKSTDPDTKNTFLRPTSEILFSHFFRSILNSYEDLPLLYNQWCNVFRSEKNTKAFLRSCEFHWQEAHTLHLTKEEAFEYLNLFHEIYKKLVKELLNIAFLEGEKTVNERFQGALKTLTLEAVMPDGQALQIATSHYLGQNFSKMFEIKFTNSNNQKDYPHQLSAGSSTRLIGALILSHSDDEGLVLPFDLADVQIKVLVINGVVNENSELFNIINNALKDYLVEWDFSNKSFGWKIKNEELNGTPFVILLGAKELENKVLLIKSRLDSEKKEVSFENLSNYFKEEIKEYKNKLLEASKSNLKNSIVKCNTLEEVKKEILENKKIALVPWFDDEENEINFKNEQWGFSPRCIESRLINSKEFCFYSGKIATVYAYFGRSY
ncbi:proline--tRNA ligase [Candidatus Mycoplasma haematobovis]|uniref:Proline--tRNA ligase n=1 Tax=Candidatus Mycoplasma haematobovis TaxID=432608 RepID=A0A1A9QCU7_9MOLU|nr:aminoacyl--tRNA ligase-related protein [Candidatus Mycoplasma haematobovis]OAL10283.1 proline--tRNA ligase [Candidatus Mycoplasma haematobovis]